ncbi:hypothetical protein B0O44_103153 [Pedobacter nutrimenti]|uniref:Uncharacterized protein n=1 Tax=Pedobacter nutrimenti TaxID=1241337 RepID=A0A318UHA8_9SPHI|nr:hypothetical protein B0O44_103153 [Pedobacter nutrimenti]
MFYQKRKPDYLFETKFNLSVFDKNKQVQSIENVGILNIQ